MTPALWEAVAALWPLMALLGYLLVTCSLRVLASHHRYAIELHNTVRESKALRRAYTDALKAKTDTVT